MSTEKWSENVDQEIDFDPNKLPKKKEEKKEEKKEMENKKEETSDDKKEEVKKKEVEKRKLGSKYVGGKSIEEQLQDESNPLFSKMKSFEPFKLSKEISKGIFEYGYRIPSGIQTKTIPIIKDTRKNLIAQSQSGTGKTGCFGIGVLSCIDVTKNYPQAIFISPTLELSLQTYEVVNKLAKYTGVKILSLLKGLKVTKKDKFNEQIIIGTPGKVFALLKKRNIDAKHIHTLVVDEADVMLEKDNKSLRKVTIAIKKALHPKVRVLLFSATFDTEGSLSNDNLLEFADAFVPKPRVEILVQREKLTLKGIKQYYILCKDNQEKLNTVVKLYENITITLAIIFVESVNKATVIHRYLSQEKNLPCSVIYGKMSADQRKKTYREFQSMKTTVLISTKVLSRGLDLKDVSLIVNFDMPYRRDRKTPDFSTYLHKIGRSGRFGKTGVAVNLVLKPELEFIKSLEKYFNITLSKVDKDDDFYEKITDE